MFTATLTLEERIARAQTQLATARAVDDPCAIQTNTSGCGCIRVSEVFFKRDRSLSYVFDS